MLSCGDGAVRVSSGVSDEVLRQVLGWDGVHVTGVRTEQAEPSGQTEPSGRAEPSGQTEPSERGERAAGR